MHKEDIKDLFEIKIGLLNDIHLLPDYNPS